MRITMIGHSTVLIEIGGKKFLTDPYWGTFGNPAYARLGAPAKTRQELCDVDGVLISHDHWDHVDSRFLRMIGDTPVVVPRPTQWLFKLMGARRVTGMEAWSSTEIGGIKVSAVPAVHLTATIGFVLEAENQRVYFAGDTFYRPFMQQIGDRYHPDVALLPVITYRIPMTMGEKEAVQAVEDLKPGIVIPIHLGITPRLPLLRTGQTPAHFAQRLKEKKLNIPVVLLREGESHTI